MYKEILFCDVDKIHTTAMGEKRISKNLKINEKDIVKYCKGKILNENSKVYRKGKNFYCTIDNVIITINASSYTIITAHLLKEQDEHRI